MIRVTLVCREIGCAAKGRSLLLNMPGRRGIHETPCAAKSCPNGHGLMVREDGGPIGRPAADVKLARRGVKT